MNAMSNMGKQELGLDSQWEGADEKMGEQDVLKNKLLEYSTMRRQGRCKM